MSYENITDETIIATLRRIASERPDYVCGAKVCRYVHGEGETAKPGCLIGHVFAELGVPLPVLAEHEYLNASGVVAELELDISKAVADALVLAQAAQDCHETWGTALRAAGLSA